MLLIFAFILLWYPVRYVSSIKLKLTFSIEYFSVLEISTISTEKQAIWSFKELIHDYN